MAGGETSGGGHLSYSEMLIKGGPSWIMISSLPRKLYAPASVSLADSVLLLGNLYQLA